MHRDPARPDVLAAEPDRVPARASLHPRHRLDVGDQLLKRPADPRVHGLCGGIELVIRHPDRERVPTCGIECAGVVEHRLFAVGSDPIDDLGNDG
jgi:hypothetical protein